MKYFSVDMGSGDDKFSSGEKIELKFTNNNTSGDIDFFTDDGTNYKPPNITIQAIGSIHRWGTSIDSIPIGSTTTSTGLFTTVGVATSSFLNGLSGVSDHNSSILDINGNTTVRGHILPSENTTFNLGSENYRFKDVYLSSSTIHIGTKSISLEGDDITFSSVKIKGNLNTLLEIF